MASTHVFLVGFSLGGFGVYELAVYKPELFDAAVAVAGYAATRRARSTRRTAATAPRSRILPKPSRS